MGFNMLKRTTTRFKHSALCLSTPRCARAHRTVLKPSTMYRTYSALYFTVRALYFTVLVSPKICTA